MSLLTCNTQEICIEEVHYKVLIQTEEQAMILSERFILKAEQIRQLRAAKHLSGDTCCRCWTTAGISHEDRNREYGQM